MSVKEIYWSLGSPRQSKKLNWSSFKDSPPFILYTVREAAPFLANAKNIIWPKKVLQLCTCMCSYVQIFKDNSSHIRLQPLLEAAITARIGVEIRIIQCLPKTPAYLKFYSPSLDYLIGTYLVLLDFLHPRTVRTSTEERQL
jgi:hypothetical protein